MVLFEGYILPGHKSLLPVGLPVRLAPVGFNPNYGIESEE
jgi:hypothetical protein